MNSSHTMAVTLAALEKFPGELEQHFTAFAPRFAHWAPPSWDGVHLAGLQWLLGKSEAASRQAP